jgi:hypothetical protein
VRLEFKLRALPWQRGLSAPLAIPPIHFVVILEMGSGELFFWAGLKHEPPDPSPQVARVTGMSHWLPANLFQYAAKYMSSVIIAKCYLASIFTLYYMRV